MNQAGTRVLVTGATGFVGAAVARALIAKGLRVRVLMRPTSPTGNLDGLGVDRVTGDLMNPHDCSRALTGVEALFHVAADYRLWAPDPQEIVRNNLAQTENIMLAALGAGVNRIVHTSSVATLKPRAQGSATEDDAARPDLAIGVYKQSKTLAERLVDRMVADQGLPAIIVNPSTPIGPRDIRPTPTGRIIVEAANGRMPGYVDSGLNLAHVDDIAEGHWLAFEKGQIGRHYVLGGENVRLGTMLADIARITGRAVPKIRLPRAPLFPLAWLNEQRARLTGADPFLTIDGLKMASHAMFFSSARAEAELGYRARPYHHGLSDAIAWFRSQGMVR